MLCPRCYSSCNYVRNSDQHWCTGCGWRSPLKAQNGRLSTFKAISVPQSKKKPEEGRKRKGGRRGGFSVFNFGTRSTYLKRYNLIEADIMQDEQGREYWLKDNFEKGESKKVLVPTRYKNAPRE